MGRRVDATRKKTYFRVREILQAGQPMTTTQLAVAADRVRERVLEAIALLKYHGEIHVTSWVLTESGRHHRVYLWGEGADAPNPVKRTRKNNPSIYSLVEAQLKMMPMSAEQIEERIYRNRASVNIALKYLLDLGHVHVICKGRSRSGRVCSIYGLGAGPLEDVVGAEEGVVVPHKLPCTRCDAENV